MRSVAILYNPESGNHDKEQILAELKEALIARGILPEDISVIQTESAGHAFEMAKYASASGVDLVVTLGGDGTINKIAAGIYESGRPTPLGIIPSGTVNNVAKALGIPLDKTEAIRILLDGQTQAVDLCRVNETYMISSLTLGILADIAVDVKQEDKRRLGPLAFLKNAWKILRRSRNYYVTLKLAETYRQVKTKIVLITMTSSVAGQVHFDQDARPNDGLMSVYLLSDLSFWKILRYLPSFVVGNFANLDEVEHFRTDQLDISQFKHGFSQKARSRVDGDKSDYLPLQLKVLQGAIRMKVPKKDEGVV